MRNKLMDIFYNGVTILFTSLIVLIGVSIFMLITYAICVPIYKYIYQPKSIIMTVNITNNTISINRINNNYTTKGKIKGYNVYYNTKINTYIDDDSRILGIPIKDTNTFALYVNERNPITFKVKYMYTIHESSSFGTFIDGAILIQSTEDLGSFAVLTMPGSMLEHDDFNADIGLHIIK